MNFNNRKFGEYEGIENCDRRVRECRRIDDNAIHRAAGLLNPVDKLRFAIALPEIHGCICLGGVVRAGGLDIVQRIVAVNLRFADPKHVKVGAVEDQYLDGCGQFTSLVSVRYANGANPITNQSVNDGHRAAGR